MSSHDDWSIPVDDLTVDQRKAVEHFEGPLLVLAGPGSGKTRVITRRIARLIERGVHPSEILAITFTNKAAREMAERVQVLMPGSRIWVSTFHRFCSRVLRERGSAIGLQPNFSIFDVSDQQQLIKQVLRDYDLDPVHFPASKLSHRISHAKNQLLTPEMYAARHGEGIGTHLEAVVAKVYPDYQKRLLEANAVDFDDLLMHVALLLQDNDHLREDLDCRFRFILVDEYQDTNRAQYQIVAALSQVHPNLCATGDPDQSIYGWRGARIENILRFEKDFPSFKIVRLEDNFRSTPEILGVADSLIAHNVYRKAKVLRTTKPSGEAVELRMFNNGQEEAVAIVNEIAALVESGERQWKDFAILYRVNSLSRTLETSFARNKVPFQVAGGVAFFERMEVKDLLGYLRLIDNPQDRIAFLRIVNVPARGIGKTSIEKLIAWADARGLSLLEAARRSSQVEGISKKAAVQLRSFASMIDELASWMINPGQDRQSSNDLLAQSQTLSDSDSEDDSQDSDPARETRPGPVEGLLLSIMNWTGYARQFSDRTNEDDMQRLSNIEELVSAARLYDAQETSEGEAATLGGFLETASLAQDMDSLDTSSGAVTLMTLHSAKGLEFPCVYIIAVEQNLIPHERSLKENDPHQLEEERRLLFVGITRAQEKLVLTHTLRREMHGRSLSTIPSDFLRELNLKNRDLTGFEDFQFGDESTDADFAESTDSASSDSADEDFHSSSQEDQGDANSSQFRQQLLSDAVPKPPSSRHDLKITTGAALLAGTREPAEPKLGLSVGMQVRHPRYGLGTVVEVGGMSRLRTVTVEFAKDSRKECFVEAKCPLQPVGL